MSTLNDNFNEQVHHEIEEEEISEEQRTSSNEEEQEESEDEYEKGLVARRRNDFRILCQDADEVDNCPSIEKLPILASEYHDKECQNNISSYGWSPKLKIILLGVLDQHSPLHALYGFEDTIIRKIYSYFVAEYLSNVKLTLPAKSVGCIAYDNDRILVRCHNRGVDSSFLEETQDLSSGDYVSFVSCGQINFPSPKDHNVNMMPFILGDIDSLPEDLQCYYECIQQCPIHTAEIGSVCYLTVHESWVEADSSQRRDGLHIEAPGSNSLPPYHCVFSPGSEHAWGGGFFYTPDLYEGGIYFASSVSNTSIVYNALIDKTVKGVVDKHGNCEYLRKFIGPGTKLEAGQLIWMTDRTPHEALPQEESGYRQFFRVVTSRVSHWFKQHSTENPKVPLPDRVVVVEENKFM